jgi:hypothetical protein
MYTRDYSVAYEEVMKSFIAMRRKGKPVKRCNGGDFGLFDADGTILWYAEMDKATATPTHAWFTVITRTADIV